MDRQYKVAQYLTGFASGLAPSIAGIDRPRGGPFPEFCSEGYEDARSGEALGLSERVPRYVAGPDVELLRELRTAAGEARNPSRPGGALHASQVVSELATKVGPKP